MLPFSISIAILSLVQAILVALPTPPLSAAAGLRSRWWALALPISIIAVISAVALDSASAQALTYLALFAVPPLGAAALAFVVRGHRAIMALAVPALFAAAWVTQGSLLGEAAALSLSALACISLGWALACLVPSAWLKLGIYAMAAVDTWLVASNLLQAPNAVLNAASPGTLPRLQFVSFGTAVMGFGDLFIAATLGALLAGDRRRQLRGAGLAIALTLAFDLLFFFVDELPATVPIALTLAFLELSRRR